MSQHIPDLQIRDWIISCGINFRLRMDTRGFELVTTKLQGFYHNHWPLFMSSCLAHNVSPWRSCHIYEIDVLLFEQDYFSFWSNLFHCQKLSFLLLKSKGLFLTLLMCQVIRFVASIVIHFDFVLFHGLFFKKFWLYYYALILQQSVVYAIGLWASNVGTKYGKFILHGWYYFKIAFLLQWSNL